MVSEGETGNEAGQNGLGFGEEGERRFEATGGNWGMHDGTSARTSASVVPKTPLAAALRTPPPRLLKMLPREKIAGVHNGSLSFVMTRCARL